MTYGFVVTEEDFVKKANKRKWATMTTKTSISYRCQFRKSIESLPKNQHTRECKSNL